MDQLDIIKKCQFLAKGYCAYETDICWFCHDDFNPKSENKSSELKEQFNCRFCEKEFGIKSEFMKHKKEEHERTVPRCREYERGACVHTENERWYRHEEVSLRFENEKESQPSVFQMAPEDNPPLDMMRRMMDLMELMVMRVDNLEKTSKNQQKVRKK